MASPFDKMNERIRANLQGRNGFDTLGTAVVGFALVCSVINLFFSNVILGMLSLMGIAYGFYRMYSKDVQTRRAENAAFERLIARPRQALERLRGGRGGAPRNARGEEMVVLVCEDCGQRLSVPKGKGTLRVVCPTCKHETTTRT